MGSFKEIHCFPPSPTDKGKNVVSRTELRSVAAVSSAPSGGETPSNTNSTFSLSKFPRAEGGFRGGNRTFWQLDSGVQSQITVTELSYYRTHTFEPCSCTKRAKRLPWSWRGPNFRSDPSALLLTRWDKGRVSLQLPQTTTLAWIETESLHAGTVRYAYKTIKKYDSLPDGVCYCTGFYYVWSLRQGFSSCAY